MAVTRDLPRRKGGLLATISLGALFVAAYLALGRSGTKPPAGPPSAVADNPWTRAPLAVTTSDASSVPAPSMAQLPQAASAQSATAARAHSVRRDTFSFKFIGLEGEGPNAAVILAHDGRVLKARAPGPLDEDYSVDVIGIDYIVLRNIHLNTVKKIEFTMPRSRLPASAPQLNDYPQD